LGGRTYAQHRNRDASPVRAAGLFAFAQPRLTPAADPSAGAALSFGAPGLNFKGGRFMTVSDLSAAPKAKRRVVGTGTIVTSLIGLALLVGIAFDTTVVRIGSDAAAGPAGFSPATYGQTEFPKIRDAVAAKAVDAPTLAAALLENKAAASEKYGVGSGGTAVFSVRFTGTAGEAKAGIYPITVAGLPEGVTVRVQTGPAINGTELRDATGTIEFGQFTNQIEYQDAGSALNNAMKAEVLAPIDTKALGGKTVEVTGAFRLVNPKNWLVTPVKLTVQ
jgi:predicted lipoprotein